MDILTTRIIEKFEKDLLLLDKMRSLYEETSELTGAMYTSMIEELNEQRAFCISCIENLKK